MERILYQLSKAIRSVITRAEPSEFIPHVLRDLIDLETRPMCLTEIAYDWCSVVYENHQRLWDWEGLLLTCLEIGFRHLDPQGLPALTHTEHHLEMIDIIFRSQNGNAIADLLHSWTIGYSLYIQRDTCAERLVRLCNLMPFSSRLRRLAIRSIELVGYEGFAGAGIDRLVELLNHLHVAVEDMVWPYPWVRILMGILQTFEGTQLLSHWYWELLVELAILRPWLLDEVTYHPRIMAFLTEAQEWSKLECWIGTVGFSWPPEADGITEEDLSCSILSLFRQRPGAFQRFGQWMEQRSQFPGRDIPRSFQRTCKQAQEAAQRDTP